MQKGPFRLPYIVSLARGGFVHDSRFWPNFCGPGPNWQFRARDQVPGQLRCRRDLNPRTDRGRPAPSPSVDVSGTSPTSIAMGRSATAPQPAGMRAVPLRPKVEDHPLRNEPLSNTGNRCRRTTEVAPEPFPASTPLPRESTGIATPSSLASPCPGARASSKATSTGSRCSSDRCTAVPASTC